MDGSGIIANSYNSLTSLVAGVSLIPGDTVRIKGLVTSTGVAVAYSNVVGLPSTQGAENFPSLVFPHGVTIGPHDATPVYLAAAGGANPAFLLRIDGSSPSATLKTRIAGINFIGGTVGLELDQSGGAGLKVVDIQGASFCRNKIGLSVIAQDAEVRPNLEDCVVTDQPPALTQNATYQGQTIGIRLHAISFSQVASKITASMDSLSTLGAFSMMDPNSFTNMDTGLTEHTDEGTRLVETYSSGTMPEHRGSNPSEVLPITEVLLDVNGGNWNGAATATGVGWDIGLYSANAANFFFDYDYSSGYRVAISGTVIEQFRLAGIHGTSSESSRGEIYLLGQTTVQHTGADATSSPFGYVHSGVHMYTFRGYLALIASDANFYSNAGHGIWLHNRAGVQRETIYPNGIYLRAVKCKSHENGMDGIGMAAGTDTSDNASRAESIVGGTWDTWGGYRSLEFQGTEPSALPQGVGRINRCAISNNGRYGISARVKGWQENDQDPIDVFSTAACRITNSYIWNNAHGGVFASMEEANAGQGSPTLLMSVVHSTVVGNGDLSGFNMEITDSAGTVVPAKFEYTSGPVGGPPEVVVCRLFNSLFQRKSSQSHDFGTHLKTLLAADNSDPNLVSDWSMGAESSRFQPTPSFTLLKYTSIDVFPEFSGYPSLNWASLSAAQFFLSGVGPLGELDACVNWNQAAPVESVLDYTGWSRTGTLALRDFGAYQKNPR